MHRCGRGGWCPHGDGHDGRRDERRANLHGQSAAAGRSDADERLAESRNPGRHGGGHADRHQFRRRRHEVTVSGAGVTVNNVVVGSSTSLTASFVLDPAAAPGARTVTVDDGRRDERSANLHGQCAGAGRRR